MLAVGQKAPSISSPVGFLIGKLTHCVWLPLALANKRVRIPRQKPQAFHNLMSDMTYHHFCPILFVRSESLGQSTLKGKDYIRA